MQSWGTFHRRHHIALNCPKDARKIGYFRQNGFISYNGYMKKVAATEAKNRLGAILDDAQREPVIIQRQERDVAVVLSMAEFERMRSANIRAFFDTQKALAAEARRNGLTEKKLKAILEDEG
jgi:prevent-host-death family protein